MASSILSRIRSISSVKAPAASPWLMLPAEFKDGDMSYNFYSLAEERVLSFKKRGRGADEIPPDDAKLVGSSHGWLASFDDKTNHVFLSNPISGRHVKLPPMDTLPDPHMNLFEGRGILSRVILSGSPEEEGCHAMTTFGPGGRLAFCSVDGAGTGWTPMGKTLSWYEEKGVKFAMRPWEDLVYCTGRGELTTIQPLAFDDWGYFVRDRYGKHEKHCQMFHWKIPKGYDSESFVSDIYNDRVGGGDENEMLKRQCIQMPHLVCAEQLSETPLIVLRFMHRGIGADADHKLAKTELYRARINTFPYTSVSFLVLKCEYYGGCMWLPVEDLKGLALFVGMNHSFAIPATGKLKPNSIYFTDAGRITPPDPDAPKFYGGHDIGIFDCKEKTISPCYYPCHYKSFKRIDPPPMWFTPSFD